MAVPQLHQPGHGLGGGGQGPGGHTDQPRGQDQALLRPRGPAVDEGGVGQEEGEEGRRAVGTGEGGELGDGVEGGGVGDQLGGQAVVQQGQEQLVGGGTSQGLL